MKKKVVCLMLAAMMALSTTTVALGAQVAGTDSTSGNIDMTTEVQGPIYKVSVPTDMRLIIDPFEQLGNNAQVTSKDFAFINKSNVPVELAVDIKITGDTDVTFKTNADDVTATSTDKLVYMQAEIAKSVTENTAQTGGSYVDQVDWTTAETVYKVGSSYYSTQVASSTEVTDEMLETTDASGTYVTDGSEVKVAIDTTHGTKLTFALQKAEYIDVFTNDTDTEKDYSLYKKVAENKNGSAVFRFAGTATTLPTWEAGDLTATVNYTFNGLSVENYTNTTFEDETNAHAYVKSAVNTPAAPTEPTTSATKITQGNAVNITYPANSTIKTVERYSASSGGYTILDSTYYEMADITNGKSFKLKDAFYDKYDSGAKIKLTFENSTTTIEITTEE